MLALGLSLLTAAGCGKIEPPVDEDGDGVPAGEDCDDFDGNTYPGANELCDGIANDCGGDLPADERDDDGDGYVVCSYDAGAWTGTIEVIGGGDCDDSDPGANPGADEVCDSEDIDEDCDGQADDDDGDATGAVTYYPDADGDGLGDSDDPGAAWCDPPTDGSPDYVTDHSDCDDSDASVAGPQTWHRDEDGDGYGDPDSTRDACEQAAGFVSDDGDCDDSDDTTSPGAAELCNGVDSDCDGRIDRGQGLVCMSIVGDTAAGYELPGVRITMNTLTSTQLGTLILGGLDLNGDGLGDLVIGARKSAPAGKSGSGGAYLFLGDASWSAGADLDASDYDFKLYGHYTDNIGHYLTATGDVNNDGRDEFLIAGNDVNNATGEAYLISWAQLTKPTMYFASASEVTFRGGAVGDNFGAGLCSPGDIDNDTHPDLVLSAYGVGDDDGAAYLFHGRAAGWANVYDVTDADTTFLGDDQGRLGLSGDCGQGDLNDDGSLDLVLGASSANSSTGSVHVFAGGASGFSASEPMANADLVLVGEAMNDQAGIQTRFVGDFDGDGIDDLAIGAPGAQGDTLETGATYIVYGGLSLTVGSVDLANLVESGGAARLDGEVTGDNLGWKLTPLGDLDLDGCADLLLGSHQQAGGTTGATYLVYGTGTGCGGARLTGSHSVAGLWDPALASTSQIRGVKFVGEAPGDAFGYSISQGGDVDGDGWGDLMMVSNGSEKSANTGLVYVVSGAALP